MNEANEFYRELAPDGMSEEGMRVMCQALAGMPWSKQFNRVEYLPAKRGPDSAPATKQAGRAWWPAALTSSRP